MNILLIYPEVIESRVFDRMPPLGLAWIAAVLRRAGYDPHILDCQVDDREPAKVAEEIQQALTLIGGTSHSRFLTFDIAARVKQVCPSTTVVYGGPHASFTAEDTLAHIPAIDIVVHGEGEKPALGLAKWKMGGG